jgi:hypothetical protein
MSAPPVLPAYRLPDNIHLVVFCPDCRLWHWHGAGDHPGDSDGHRVAHCPDKYLADPRRLLFVPNNGGLQNTGYILREVGWLTREIRDQHEPRPRISGGARRPPVVTSKSSRRRGKAAAP